MQQQTVVNDSGFLKYSWAHVAIFNIFLLAWSFFMHYHLRAQRSSTFNWGFLHVLWFLWIPWIFLQYYVWYCQTLSSSAFVSSPIYDPSCFPVIISSVSVSRVSWLCPRCLQLMSPYIYSLFCPMLPVDYCKCHVSNLFGCSSPCSCVSSVRHPLNTLFVTSSSPRSWLPRAAPWQVHSEIPKFFAILHCKI